MNNISRIANLARSTGKGNAVIAIGLTCIDIFNHMAEKQRLENESKNENKSILEGIFGSSKKRIE